MGEDAWRRVLKTRAHLWLSNVHEHGMEGGCTAGCTAPVQFYAFFVASWVDKSCLCHMGTFAPCCAGVVESSLGTA